MTQSVMMIVSKTGVILPVLDVLDRESERSVEKNPFCHIF